MLFTSACMVNSPEKTSFTDTPSIRYFTSFDRPPRKWPSTTPACRFTTEATSSSGSAAISSPLTEAVVDVRSFCTIGRVAVTTHIAHFDGLRLERERDAGRLINLHLHGIDRHRTVPDRRCPHARTSPEEYSGRNTRRRYPSLHRASCRQRMTLTPTSASPVWASVTFPAILPGRTADCRRMPSNGRRATQIMV